MATNGSKNGRARTSDKVRVAIVGVGNCASSLVQGVEYYKDADPGQDVPGLMHVDLGGYHISDVEFVAAFDVDADKVGKDLSQAIFSGQNNTVKFSDVPNLGVKVQRGMTHDGIGKYLSKVIKKAPGATSDVVQVLKDTRADVLVSLPARRLRDGHQVVRRAGAAGRRRLRQLHPGVHRARGLLEQAVREGGPADRRRRHQVAGRRDDRAPRAGPPLRRPRRQAGAHVPAQRRRQHGLPQHARARAAGVQEDLQDERRHVAARVRPRRGQRAHRPVRPRALADRPQVGVHPPRGPLLRRRAAGGRAQARGVGLAELRRHRHRRRAPGQARPRPRHRRRARVPVGVPHEVAARAAPRREGARRRRGLHRGAPPPRCGRPVGARRRRRSRPPRAAPAKTTAKAKGKAAPAAKARARKS